MMLALLQPSIARRMTLALLLACALVWSVVYGVGRCNMLAAGSGSFDREVRITADAAQHLAETHGDSRELGLALAGLGAEIEAQERLGGNPRGFLAFRVVDVRGHVVGGGGQGPEHWPPPAERVGFRSHSANGQLYRMHSSTTADGRLHIDVSQSHLSRQRAFDEVMFSYEGLQPLLFGFPLLLLPVWLAVHTGLSPLRRLARELAARPPADLTPVREPPVYRELAPLVQELNGAFTRLASLLKRERDFLADAAHQLRTPLALISAQCDTLQQAQTAPARESALKRLQGGLTRAGRLVNQLLALARLEANVEDRLLPTDIADVARDCLAAHASAALAQRIELGYVGPDSLSLCCPGHAVEAIIDNLVGNAIRYGREGGQVELRVETTPAGQIAVQVSDDGPGIAAADRAVIFERFRRGGATSVSGSGLGLAIVKSAARQLGAQIELLPGLGGAGVAIRLDWRAIDQALAPTRPRRLQSSSVSGD